MPNTYLKKVSPQEFQQERTSPHESLDSSSVLSFFTPALQQIDTFAIGRYFWFIADTTTFKNLYTGGVLEEMIPVKMDEFIGGAPDVLFANCFPEDLEKMLSFSQYFNRYYGQLTVSERKHIRTTIFIRLKNLQGQYYWVMVQYLDVIFNSEGRLLYMLTLITDVSHLKKDGVATMTIMDSRNKQSQLFLCVDGVDTELQQTIPKISDRELEVLSWIVKGYSSKQIADTLHLARKTVDNHRQNLLRKTQTKSTGELVAFAMNHGVL
ncbi:MAG: helix-turn-helix transcriptional regulator [Cyclobacteriaceae bacterium]|nr:helix-turn-helix transcriptional regulator [Cyclobacteriaceae bacterium]